MPETANQTPPEPPPESPPEEGSGGSGDERVEEARREAAKHRRDLRAAQQANDELRAEAERRRVESESEQERAIREAVETKEAELRQEFAAERLHNRLRIRAAQKLRDPEDAVLHLGGTLAPDADDAAIDEALVELLKQRDYLAAPNGAVVAEAGLVTQGARSGVAPGQTAAEPDDWIRSRARRG